MAVPKTIRTGKAGNRALALVLSEGRYIGLADRVRCVEGEDADDVWRRLHDEAGRADPRYFGYDGARARFLELFPDGFASGAFASHERDYKIAAKAGLDEAAPLEDALTQAGLGEAVLRTFRATNLLAPVEKARVQDLLRGPEADAFVAAAARFTAEPGARTLARLERVLATHDSAKWTVATYLPLLWRPEAHMFLKPEVTQDFAARVGHPFADAYTPRLEFPVYAALQDLTDRTAAELADLGPRDRIDVQSFIWIVGAYGRG